MIRKVIFIGLIANTILMTLKLSVGYWGHSEALVADGFHSFNDIAADFIILIFTGVAYKAANTKYNYGYGKFETFAAFLIGILLIVASIHILHEGIESIVAAVNGEILEKPDIWTVIVALFAIATKETLFRYTRYVGKKTGSSALMANSWHHRSDAMATFATLVGVSAAHFMGESWRILDPIASLLISFFILIPALKILIPAFRELMERSIDDSLKEKIEKDIESFEDVKGIKTLNARKSGRTIFADTCIEVNPSMTIAELDKLSANIKTKLSEDFSNQITIHISATPQTSN